MKISCYYRGRHDGAAAIILGSANVDLLWKCVNPVSLRQTTRQYRPIRMESWIAGQCYCRPSLEIRQSCTPRQATRQYRPIQTESWVAGVIGTREPNVSSTES
jgi:hypothetical protein